MDIKNIVSDLEKTKEFSEWKENNNGTYLVHLFKMLDKANVDEWQIGYYDKNNRKITTFVYNEETKAITLNPEAEVFKEDETHIEKLDLDKVSLNLLSAMHKAEKLKEDKYSTHPTDKAFLILQKLNIGIVWNFTFITKTFHVLNMKINAENGHILEDKLSSIMEFKGQ